MRLTLIAGSTASNATARFRFYDSPHVRALRPRQGSTAGGDTLLVLGSGFGPFTDLGSGLALCRFGSHALASPTGSGLLRPAGAALDDAPLRTHQPRLVTTPASVVHRGAIRCRTPAAATIGAHEVSVSLNGVDFSSATERALPTYEYYDNWRQLLVGGVPPSLRAGHAVARVGRSLWLFGGEGNTRTRGGGWATSRASPVGRGALNGEVYDGGHTGGAAQRDETAASRGLFSLHNDLHELRTGIHTEGYYPSLHALDVGWHEVDYTSYEASSTSGGGGSQLRPAPSPRARGGHTLTALGGRLFLVGGEAESRVEYQLAERFRVTGVQVTTASLTPRVRGHAGDVPPPRYPATILGNVVPPRGGDMGQGMGQGMSQSPYTDIGVPGATAVDAPRIDWDEQPLWVASEAVTTYELDAEQSMSHATHGDRHLIRDDLDGVDHATHVGSDVYVQRQQQLSDAHVFDPRTASWEPVVLLDTSTLEARTGHAAAAIGTSTLVVFGGWRLRPCRELRPCGEFMNDLQLLRLERRAGESFDGAGLPSEGAVVQATGAAAAAAIAPSAHRAATRGWWERPSFDGVAPLPRRGHTLTWVDRRLGGVGGDGLSEGDGSAGSDGGSSDQEDEGDATLLVMFGLGYLWNASSQIGRGIHLNDVHLLSRTNSTWAWRPLHISGTPPAPRAAHTATMTPDGQQLIVLGGMNEGGVLSDAHVLDLSQSPAIWWQLKTSTDAPLTPRHSHTASLFGTDLLLVGGLSPSAYIGSVEVLNLVSLVLETSAPIASRLAQDAGLNASCALLLGSPGSPVQRYACQAATPDRDMHMAART